MKKVLNNNYNNNKNFLLKRTVLRKFDIWEWERKILSNTRSTNQKKTQKEYRIKNSQQYRDWWEKSLNSVFRLVNKCRKILIISQKLTSINRFMKLQNWEARFCHFVFNKTLKIWEIQTTNFYRHMIP